MSATLCGRGENNIVPFGEKRTDEEIREEISRRIGEKWKTYCAVISVDHGDVL